MMVCLRKKIIVEFYLVLNSFGLSNMQIDENASSYDKGAQVGNLGLKYGTGKDKATPSDDETVLKNGDYITAIRIHGNSEWTVINDWSDLISNLNAYTDVISIDYKFYSQDKKKKLILKHRFILIQMLY